MDEPLSALDALTRENLQQLILKIWFQRRITIVLVTHSIEEAVFLGQEIIVLSQCSRADKSGRYQSSHGRRRLPE